METEDLNYECNRHRGGGVLTCAHWSRIPRIADAYPRRGFSVNVYYVQRTEPILCSRTLRGAPGGCFWKTANASSIDGGHLHFYKERNDFCNKVELTRFSPLYQNIIKGPWIISLEWETIFKICGFSPVVLNNLEIFSLCGNNSSREFVMILILDFIWIPLIYNYFVTILANLDKLTCVFSDQVS